MLLIGIFIGIIIGGIAGAIAVGLCRFLAYDTAIEENAALRQALNLRGPK